MDNGNWSGATGRVPAPGDACEKSETDIFEQLGQENLLRALSTETLEETPK